MMAKSLFVTGPHKLQGNILIDDDGRVSLIDFGLSRILKISGFTTKISGTIRYMAVELLEAEDVAKVTAPTDVWAFAMTVIEVRVSHPQYIGVMYRLSGPHGEQAIRAYQKRLRCRLRGYVR
jgi:serine/threonine protein kinase